MTTATRRDVDLSDIFGILKNKVKETAQELKDQAKNSLERNQNNKTISERKHATVTCFKTAVLI